MPADARILIQIDHNPHPRVFDQIMSLDGAADHVLPHGDVDPQDVPLLVAGALYSRPLEELSRTAILVTGTNDHVIDEIVRQVRRSFFGAYRVSLLSECKGGNAVAGAAVARIARLIEPSRSKTVVIAGGSAGSRVAGLMARLGADPILTVFDDEEAADRSSFVRETFGIDVPTVVWKSGEPLNELIHDAQIIVSAGPPGLQLLPRDWWEGLPSLDLLVDISGAEPAGIEGLTGEEDGEPVSRDGRPVRGLGGLAISRYKIQVHREAVRQLFEPEAVVLGPVEVAEIAARVMSG